MCIGAILPKTLMQIKGMLQDNKEKAYTVHYKIHINDIIVIDIRTQFKNVH